MKVNLSKGEGGELFRVAFAAQGIEAELLRQFEFVDARIDSEALRAGASGDPSRCIQIELRVNIRPLQPKRSS